jgi:hypothetical protein
MTGILRKTRSGIKPGTVHTYSPVLRQADLPQHLTIPWLAGRTLTYEYA